MTKIFFKKGISVVELLVVLAGVGILVAITLPQFLKMKENQVLKNTVEDTLSAINKARSETLASVDSSEYGVHFQADRIVIFKGKIFSTPNENNKSIDIISPASISDVTLGGVSGTSGDVYFNRIFGVPNLTGTITISTPSSSRIITIYPTGASGAN